MAMIRYVITVIVSTVFGLSAAELRCSEESFAALGGAIPSAFSPAEYSTCVQGVVFASTCPEGHYFDALGQRCTIDEDVQDKHTKTTYQFEELCDNPDVVQIFPNPTNCSQYIICYGSVPIEQTCGNGLLFNPQLNACDIPTNVVCGYSCPSTDDPYNPVWLPDSRLEDCSRHYLCFQGEPLLFYCYNNLYFDIVTRTCSYPEYSACRVPGVYCNSNSTETIVNPRSCTSYYVCVDGFPHFRDCGFDQYFAPELGICVEGSCPPSTTTSQPSTNSTVEITTTEGTNMTTPSFTTMSPPFTPTDPTPTFNSTTQETPFPPTTVENTSSTPAITEETTTPSPNTTTGVLTTTEAPTTVTDFTTTELITTTTESTTTFTEIPTTTTEITTTESPTTTTEFTTTDIVTTTTESATTTTEFTTTDFVTTTTESATTTTEFTTTDFITTTTESATTTTEFTTTDFVTTTTEEPVITTEFTTTDFVTTTTELPTTEFSTTDLVTTTTEVLTTSTEFTTTDFVTTTTESTTTSTVPTTTIDPAEFCAGIDVDALPYPGNCYMYVVCIGGNGMTSMCAPNHIFNPVIKVCVPGDPETCTLG